MSKELFKEEGFFFTIFFYMWEFLTWGYIAEIIFFLFCVLSLFFALIVLANWRVISYMIREKYLFVRYFLYDFIMQKIMFLKSYYITVRWQLDKWNWQFWIIVIVITLIVIIGMIWAWFTVMDMAAEKAANAQNITL